MPEDPDAETAIEASEQIIHLDAELKEDIGAEIEDLVLLRRLGYNEDALDVTTTVLLPHVCHFPVFAEVSAYLWCRNDFQTLSDVCSSLGQSGFTWDPREITYFENMGRKRHERHLPVDDGFLDKSYLDKGYLDKGVPLDSIDLQFLEVYLHTAPSRIFCPKASSGTANLLFALFNRLVAEKSWLDAADIFRKYCEHYPIRKSENADAKFILDLYNHHQTDYSKSIALLHRDLEEDFEAFLPSTLAILSAKTALMLYIVRIYDAEVEVLVKFVLAGMPPLHKLNEEVQAILRMLSVRLGFDYTRSDYHAFGEACIKYWKHSEGCAATVRRLNDQIRRFTDSLVPEIIAVPFEHWFIRPPIAVH